MKVTELHGKKMATVVKDGKEYTLVLDDEGWSVVVATQHGGGSMNFDSLDAAIARFPIFGADPNAIKAAFGV